MLRKYPIGLQSFREIRQGGYVYIGNWILLQIGHLINQLALHSRRVAAMLRDNVKLTQKHLWDIMRSLLIVTLLSEERLADNERHGQKRLE